MSDTAEQLRQAIQAAGLVLPEDDARHFLEAFYSGAQGVPELRRLRWNRHKGKYVEPESFFCTNLGELVKFATTGKGDVFHGVATRKPGAQSGKKGDCFEALAVHIDVDFKETPEERFNECLEAFPYPPTIIISSGNGAHCYWLFEKPLRVDDDEENREFIEAVNRGMAKVFGGDDTHDISRVLRTPGRPNSKYETAPMCRIQSNSGPRYDIDTLAPYAIKATTAGKTKVTLDAIPEELPERFRSLLVKNKKVQDTWNGERSDLKDQSRSGYDMAMAGLLALHGFTANENAGVLKQFPYGKGSVASDDYLEHTISKVMSDRGGGAHGPEGSAQRARHDDWPEPKPIQSSLYPVPTFDASVLLPDPLQAWIADEADRMPCPPDFVAPAALVALGAIIGARCAIKPKFRDDWLVIPNLWGGIVGLPSAKKSPAIGAALKPLDRLIAKAMEVHRIELETFEAKRTVFEAQKEAIESEIKLVAKAKKANGSNGSTLDALAKKLQSHRQETPQAPVLRRYKTNDTTVEKLGELLRDNPTGLLVLRDELVGLIATWDREGREGERAFFLEAWNGNSSFDTDRIKRGSIFIPNLCVCIFGGVQPDKLTGYLEQAAHALANDGMLQRFQLLVFPDHREWVWCDRLPDKVAREKAFAVFDALVDFDPVDWGASRADDFVKFPYFRFDELAQEIFIEWSADLHRVRLPAEDNPLMAQHLAKFDKLFPALALVLHLVDCAATGRRGPVTKEAALRAAAWCDYLEAHARRCYGLLADDGLRAAQALADKVRQGKLKNGFTARDVRRNQWRNLTTDEPVQAALDWLEDEEWLRPEKVGGAGPGTGRQTWRYSINPKIAEPSDKRGGDD